MRRTFVADRVPTSQQARIDLENREAIRRRARIEAKYCGSEKMTMAAALAEAGYGIDDLIARAGIDRGSAVRLVLGIEK